MSEDLFMRELALVKAELSRQKRRTPKFRWVTVTATDARAYTFDADTDDGDTVSGLTVDRGAQIMPAVGDRVLLTIDGATPRYDRPSRIYPAALDPVTGEVLASMDETGKVSGGEGSFDSLYIGGQLVVPRFAEDQDGPRGFIEYGGQYVNTAATSTELGIYEVSADLEIGRMYLIETTSLTVTGTAGLFARTYLRMSDDGTTPTLADDVIATNAHTCAAQNDTGKVLRRAHTPTVTGTHRFLLSVGRVGGSAGTCQIAGSQTFPLQMWVQDVGPYRGNNAVANDGSGAATTVKKTYTKTYGATWSGSYNGTTLDTGHGNLMEQGIINGDWRAMVGFNSATIVSDLSGATVESCVVYLYANDWYNDTGGTALIGSHNNSSRPGTWTSVNPVRWTQSSWPKPGGRRVNLGASVGDEFKAGTTKGITLGPAPNTSKLYCGRFSGEGTSREPYLEIRYSK